MKVLDLAQKDLLRAMRGVLFWAFGLAVPLLTSALFFFAFGGLSGGDDGMSVPATKVWLVNLDTPSAQTGGFSAGQLLAGVLKAEELAELLQVTETADPVAARAAVDRQEAGVAVIVPADFTAAAFGGAGQSAVELYHDPTLTLGPGIVEGILRQVVDGLAGSLIAVEVAGERLAGQGQALDPALARQIATQYAAWATAQGQAQEGAGTLLDLQAPPGGKAGDMQAAVTSMLVAGMSVLYVFFTGAAMAQTILEEEEAGTLPRLFTTPTSQAAILGGKLIAALVTLAVQMVVLIVASSLAFGLSWGRPPAVAVVTVVLILLAASFGLFITSLLKNTRQSGIVYGGVLTTMGMLGMMSVFTGQVPGAGGGAFRTLALLVPQGWAVRAWETTMQGGGIADLAGPLAVMLALAIAFFVLGVLRFRKRYA